MGELRLTSVAAADLAGLFAGSPQIESVLQQAREQRFGAPITTPQRGLLAKAGPLTRVPAGAPIVRPDVPTAADVHDLTRGRFVRPDRLSAAWALVHLYLEVTGWPTFALDVPLSTLDELDFELATGGVPTTLSLRALLNGRLELPLRPRPGQLTGLVDADRARALRDAWRPAVATLSPHHAAVAGQIVGWLGQLESWEDFATHRGLRRPDLAVFYDEGPDSPAEESGPTR